MAEGLFSPAFVADVAGISGLSYIWEKTTHIYIYRGNRKKSLLPLQESVETLELLHL